MSITMATILTLLFMPFSILILIGVAICILMANHLIISTLLMVLLVGWTKYSMVRKDYSNRRPAIIIMVHLLLILFNCKVYILLSSVV